jgi:two-component system phosphate regulon response regulator PhoB
MGSGSGRHRDVTCPTPSGSMGQVHVGTMPKVLVVDDEPDMVEMLGYHLREAGYGIGTAMDGVEALEIVRTERPDLILLDLMLPGMDGFEVCKALRRDPVTAAIPVIVVSARSMELDRVLALELGADDYVTKPFSPRELLLRIRRSLGRARTPDKVDERLKAEELVVDASAHRAWVLEEEVALTATEFRLLATLMGRRGRVLTRAMLLQEVWERREDEVDVRTVDTHVRRLRDKLKSAARFIDTVRGVGYRFRV